VPAVSSLGAFVAFLDTTIVNVAFETISHSFHATAGHLAWVLNAYSLVFAAAFYGMLLSNIIFLQTVWHYSVLRAALPPAGCPSPC
jgi:MFS family permease